ncbi:ER lumen protein retaining receptor-domain-containing protein [Amylocarpus encephaloides]|uniref:ER lumen protein retaining receptor-domain-containing protein n=1 Tax=Amylocarpus encephaloides TaxID=45428 RepID=A0A9P7YME2_9HELO|nr:ER lumen protein retaining receptor-domain-containing protein [Amylocarpus encephaloides]
MPGMNIFRILADVAHTLSKCILIYAIHRNKSSEGVSLITQALYALVFMTRYVDIFDHYAWWSVWNFTLKIFYLLSSFYIIFLMMKVYARTREREKAWKFGAACLFGSAVLTPFVMMIFAKKELWGFREIFWVFSIILESVAVLPQLLLLRQTTVPTVIDSFYLISLGSYRALYILNWIVREVSPEGRKPEPIPIIFGVIQTAFYIDFFWVYYSRQRVKLRYGGIVDAEDVQRGWILNKIFGNKRIVGNLDDDEESAPALGGNNADNGRRVAPRTGSNWGSRGISVSADDGVLESESDRVFQEQEEGIVGVGDEDPDAKMKDPDELARILEDDGGHSSGESSVTVGNGSEWRDGRK